MSAVPPSSSASSAAEKAQSASAVASASIRADSSQSLPAHRDHDGQRRAGPAGPAPSTHFGLTPEQQLQLRSAHMSVPSSSPVVEKAQSALAVASASPSASVANLAVPREATVNEPPADALVTQQENMGDVPPVPLGAVVAAPSAPAAAPATGASSHTAPTQAESGKTADIEMETGDLPVCGLTESHSQSSPAHNVQGEQGRAEPTDLTTSTHFPLPSEQVQRRSTHMPDVSPSSSAVEEAQPRAVASTVASLAEEAKADEPADAHMAVQEGEGAQPAPQCASLASEAAPPVAAAEASNHVEESVPDGSDEMAMENRRDEVHLDGGVMPDDQGTAAARTVTAPMMEAKEDEPAGRPISAEAVAAAAAAAAATAAAAAGADDSSHQRMFAQDRRDARMAIAVGVGNQPAEGAELPGRGAGAAAAAAGRNGQGILSLANDPVLAVGNSRPVVNPRRAVAVMRPLRVASKRKVVESGLDADEGDDSKEQEEEKEEEKKEEEEEEQDEEERKSEAEDDAADAEHEWTRLMSVNKRTVRVLWANGEITSEPRVEFERQVDPMHFAYHTAVAKMPPKRQREMLAAAAKSRSKAATSEHQPRASRSGHLATGYTRSIRKSKKPRCDPERKKDEDGINDLQTMMAAIDISNTTCSYCGCVNLLCFRCTTAASCIQRMCMQCWTLASSSSCMGVAAASDRFRCREHGGTAHLPIYPTVQRYGLPLAQPQLIGVLTSHVGFPSYRSQFDAPMLKIMLLSAGGLSSGEQRPAAVLLEYHSDVDHGHACFDEPTQGRSTEPDTRQVDLLARFIDPATTKLVVLLTCGPYRKQLEEIRAASRGLYPHTTFLLFDIAQLFVRDVLSAVCSTVRQCLLYPSASPLHLAAENFGKHLLQAYRPSFLFRGQLLPVVHHSQDALTKCACGVTLKSHGLAHKAVGWEAFERFQLFRYKCKKSPGCGAAMLLPRI